MEIINSFIENMLVTIGMRVIAVGLNLIIGFAGQLQRSRRLYGNWRLRDWYCQPKQWRPRGIFLSMIVGMVIAVAAVIVGINITIAL